MFSVAVKKLNFAQRLHTSRPDHIFLVRGKDTSGRRAWYYVLTEPGKRDVFKTRGGVPFLKLTDYGQVLESGFGENPPEEIRDMMEDEYGFKE